MTSDDYFGKANLLTQQKNYKDALLMYEKALELCKQNHQCCALLSQMIICRYNMDGNKKYMDSCLSRIDAITNSCKIANDYNSYILCKKSTIDSLYVIIEDDDYAGIKDFAQKFFALMEDFLKYEKFLMEQIRVHFSGNELLTKSYWFCKQNSFTPTSFAVRDFFEN